MGKEYNVLLVDDSEDDRWLLRRALQSSEKLRVIGELDNGGAAMDYLAGTGRFSSREKHPFPDVILLDLKMPRITGHEVLRWLKAQPFADLFVAVISGSILAEDTSRSMALGAQVHYAKDSLLKDQKAMIHGLEQMVEQFKHV